MSTKSVKESRRSYLADAAEELVASASDSTFDATTFFEKFELLVHIPEAVQRFRELIIENCVLGRFTTTDERETVASDYQLEPSFPTCKPNWRTLNFGKYCDIQGGNQPPKSEFIDEPKDGYIRLLQIRDLGDKPVPTYIPVESTNRFCTEGEILIGRYGASVGKIFWAQPGAYNVALAKFIYPSDAYIPIYAFWLLKSAVFQRRVLASSRSAQAGFNKGDLASIDFPLPPLAEQKRIVGKVNELMGLCDRLEALEAERKERHASLSRATLARFADSPTPTNLQFLFHKSFDVEPAELRESILTLAVCGKLVDRKSEVDVKPIEEALAEPTFNGVSKGPTKDTLKTEVLRISAGTSRRDFRVNEDDFKHVDLTSDEIGKCRLKPGDLLACRFNGNLHYVGRFSIYEGTSGRVQVNPDKLIRFRIDTSRHLATYICYAMNSPPTRRLIESLCATTAGNIGLSASKLRTVEIPLPPFAGQKRIVAKVDELMAPADQFEQQRAHPRTRGHTMLAAT